MASVRPIPESYYYSGQGRLALGDRNPTTGALSNLVFVGNVTSLTLDIATTKFEHKESMSGQRAIDLTIIQEKNATFSFTSESLDLAALASGLYGTQAAVAGSTVTDETHLATKGKAIPLLHPNVSSVAVDKTGSPDVACVEGTDFAVDEGFGTVYILNTATVITVADTPVKITYTYGAYDKLEAFTVATPPERYLRFEGLNTINGDLRLIDIYRGAFDPLTGLEFINEELGSGEFNGTMLPDTTITTTGLSQYFKERRVTV